MAHDVSFEIPKRDLVREHEANGPGRRWPVYHQLLTARLLW